MTNSSHSPFTRGDLVGGLASYFHLTREGKRGGMLMGIKNIKKAFRVSKCWGKMPSLSLSFRHTHISSEYGVVQKKIDTKKKGVTSVFVDFFKTHII